MADWNRIGRALGGFAAGYGGSGGEYLYNLQRADQMKMIEEERKRKESQERQQSTEQRTANQIRMARQRMEQNPVAALPLINEMLMGIPGAERSPLGQIKQSILASQTTGVVAPGQKQQILGQAAQQLRALEDSFINRGLLQPEQPKQEEEYTLAPGAKRFRGGEMVAENKDETAGAAGNNRASAISRAYDNGTTLQVLPDGSTVVRDPSGKIVEGQERIDVLTKARTEQIEFARQRAEAGGIGTGSSERINSTIVDGMDVAASAATLRRGIELLDSVKTGGLNAVASRARQFFGVEGADEGELSANLGQAVLSQLKPIFGSAFTEREGARLERISAGFGRNPETNARLLKQLLSVVERDANRAIDAAISIRDFRTADEIQELLNFNLSDEGGATEPSADGLTEEERQELESLREWANGRR